MADEPKWLRALRSGVHLWTALCVGFVFGWTFSYYWPISDTIVVLQSIVMQAVLCTAFVPAAILEIVLIIRARRMKLKDIASERERLAGR